MTTIHPITRIPDAWVNGTTSPKDRRGTNYGESRYTQVKSGERLTFLRPNLPPIQGLTVLDAYLVGRSAGTAAQTLTVAPVAERWQPGRVRWSNRPVVTAAAAVSRSVAAAGDGKVVTVTGLAPILQAVADGTPWFGLRVATSATTPQSFYALHSGQPAWELHVVVSDLSEPADDLRPDGGGAVGSAVPRLAWSADNQVTRRVQVDTPVAGLEPDAVAPDYDSGVETTPSQEFDLGATGHVPSGAGPHFWRVLVVREGATGTPEWSDWAEFTVAALPSLILDSPVGAFGDTAPTLRAHLSSGVLAKWKVTITGPSRGDVIRTYGFATGPIEWTIPERTKGRQTLVEGGWINLRAFDDVDRAVAVGERDFAHVWIPVTFADTSTLLEPTNLMVTPVGYRHPQQEWRWQRTAPADAWVLRTDGADVRRLDASEVTANAGTYTWRDKGQIVPSRTHSYTVRAVEGTARSLPARLTKTHDVEGVWIIPDNGDPILLDEGDVAGWGTREKRATFETQVGPDVDVIYDSNPGRTGSFEGLIGADWEREPVWDVVDRLKALREPGNRLCQLVWPGASIRVRLSEVDVTPATEFNPTNLRHVVRFEFREDS